MKGLALVRDAVEFGSWMGKAVVTWLADRFHIDIMSFDVILSRDQQTIVVKVKGNLFGFEFDFEHTLDFGAIVRSIRDMINVIKTIRLNSVRAS